MFMSSFVVYNFILICEKRCPLRFSKHLETLMLRILQHFVFLNVFILQDLQTVYNPAAMPD